VDLPQSMVPVKKTSSGMAAGHSYGSRRSGDPESLANAASENVCATGTDKP
jgi:hypothetical protein